MALSFGENLGVLGNIKLTDVKLVAGAFRTIASGSDTGSITVQRVEDGQIVYIQSEDKLIKANKAGASVTWSDFFFPSASAGAETAGIFVATGSSFNTTNDLEITGSLSISNGVVDMSNSTAISGSTFSGSFVGDASGLTGIALSGSMSSTGSFGELEVTTDQAQGTGSFDHVKATTFEGYGGDLTGIMTLTGFENAVVITDDGSEDITVANMIFITDSTGDVVTWQ